MVNLSLDRLSNIHNEPIVCGVVTKNAGNIFLVNSINTTGHPQNAKHLAEVAQSTLKKCEEE